MIGDEQWWWWWRRWLVKEVVAAMHFLFCGISFFAPLS
jgi:hypothetical protein